MRRSSLALDAFAVVAFVAIGRSSHHHVQSVAGYVSTAWPFVLGLAVGWLTVIRRPPMSLWTGLAVCLSTVIVGMTLRVIAGQGTAVSFIIVALTFLGAVMVGGRGLLVASRRRWSLPTRHR